MRGFVAHTEHLPQTRLALVGPDVEGVTDDPEGAHVYAECHAAWRALPEAARRRVALVLLPMDDVAENGAMVNAIQRRATVVVQKSLQEGFGLTVTEAMWKARPLIASAVGGIPDQIEHERHGLLVQDPENLDEFGQALRRLLEDAGLARRLGRNARRRCMAHFIAPRHLTQYVGLLAHLAGLR
jgi:trehalose synthase